MMMIKFIVWINYKIRDIGDLLRFIIMFKLKWSKSRHVGLNAIQLLLSSVIMPRMEIVSRKLQLSTIFRFERIPVSQFFSWNSCDLTNPWLWILLTLTRVLN